MRNMNPNDGEQPGSSQDQEYGADRKQRSRFHYRRRLITYQSRAPKDPEIDSLVEDLIRARRENVEREALMDVHISALKLNMNKYIDITSTPPRLVRYSDCIQLEAFTNGVMKYGDSPPVKCNTVVSCVVDPDIQNSPLCAGCALSGSRNISPCVRNAFRIVHPLNITRNDLLYLGQTVAFMLESSNDKKPLFIEGFADTVRYEETGRLSLRLTDRLMRSCWFSLRTPGINWPGEETAVHMFNTFTIHHYQSNLLMCMEFDEMRETIFGMENIVDLHTYGGNDTYNPLKNTFRFCYKLLPEDDSSD